MKCNFNEIFYFQYEENSKPVYGLIQVEWGSFRNAKANRDKYWYFGTFRDYISYIFTKVEKGAWECSYTEPCKGCNKCVQKEQVTQRWWHVFMPSLSKTGIFFAIDLIEILFSKHQTNIHFWF